MAPTPKTLEATKAILRESYSVYSFPASTINVLPDPEGTIIIFYYGYPEGDETSSGNEMNVEIGEDFANVAFDATGELFARILDNSLKQEERLQEISTFLNRIKASEPELGSQLSCLETYGLKSS